jgi:hypothetical protein
MGTRRRESALRWIELAIGGFYIRMHVVSIHPGSLALGKNARRVIRWPAIQKKVRIAPTTLCRSSIS